MIYGDLPEDLGLIDRTYPEMMFWLYCPIHTPREGLVMPDSLAQFWPIVQKAMAREGGTSSRYVYLTAKTLWVSEGATPNRPGWHADGFGTDDVNYIWYDRAPTEFIEDSFTLPDDCADAMAAMTQRAERRPIITYPAKHLLRLTPSVIHRVPEGVPAGLRTFLKISISRDRYNLEGNSVNHELREAWPRVPRGEDRNHPHAAEPARIAVAA